MKRIAWLTDIHLNFLASEEVRDFMARIVRDDPDGRHAEAGDPCANQSFERSTSLVHLQLLATTHHISGWIRGTGTSMRRNRDSTIR